MLSISRSLLFFCLLLVIVLASPVRSLAQMSSGDKAFEVQNYFLAIDSYKKAIKSKEKKSLSYLQSSGMLPVDERQ